MDICSIDSTSTLTTHLVWFIILLWAVAISAAQVVHSQWDRVIHNMGDDEIYDEPDKWSLGGIWTRSDQVDDPEGYELVQEYREAYRMSYRKLRKKLATSSKDIRKLKARSTSDLQVALANMRQQRQSQLSVNHTGGTDALQHDVRTIIKSAVAQTMQACVSAMGELSGCALHDRTASVVAQSSQVQQMLTANCNVDEIVHVILQDPCMTREMLNTLTSVRLFPTIKALLHDDDLRNELATAITKRRVADAIAAFVVDARHREDLAVAVVTEHFEEVTDACMADDDVRLTLVERYFDLHHAPPPSPGRISTIG